MHRHLCVVLVSILSGALPAVATAQDPGSIFVGLRGGLTSTSVDSAMLTTELRSRGHNVTATVDDSDSMVGFYVGKMMTSNFAVELGYMNLGEYNVRVTGTTTQPAQLAQDVVDTQPKTGDAVSFIGRFQIPLATRLQLVPRIGGFVWNSQTTVITGSGSQDISDDGLGLALGLGLDVAATRGLHLGLGWELLRPDKEGTNTAFYGQVEYYFGRP